MDLCPTVTWCDRPGATGLRGKRPAWETYRVEVRDRPLDEKGDRVGVR